MTQDSLLLENLPDGVLLVEAGGTIRRANARAAELFHIAPSEMPGRPISAFFTGFHEAAWNACKERSRAEAFVNVQTKTDDSTDRPARISIRRIEADEECWCLHFRLPTSEMEDRRLEMEIKFLTLFENSTDGLALFEKQNGPGDDNTLIMCNESYVSMAGRSREELMRTRIQDLLIPVEAETPRLSVFDEKEFDRVHSWLRPDGAENYVATRFVDVELGDKHYVYSINHDITAQRHIEEMFRREHCAVENAGTGIVILDTNLVITYLNPATAELLQYGYTGELLGSAAIRLWVDPVKGQNLLQEALEHGRHTRAESRLLCSDNTALDAEVSAASIYDNEGTLKGLVLSLLDISDRKKAEQQHAMMASLGAACHHLGQPAQILMATLSMLREEHSGDPELIDICEKAVDRIGEILRKLSAVTEFKTVPYAQCRHSERKDVILDI